MIKHAAIDPSSLSGLILWHHGVEANLKFSSGNSGERDVHPSGTPQSEGVEAGTALISSLS